MKTRKYYQLNRWHHGFAGAFLKGYDNGTLDRNRKRCAVRSCKRTFKTRGQMRWCERCGNRMCTNCEVFTGDGFICKACHAKQKRDMDFWLFQGKDGEDAEGNTSTGSRYSEEA